MNCCRSDQAVPARSQGGAALLIALFVLAVAMVVVTGLSKSAIIAARRAENQLLADQAWYYLIGVEELAIELLKFKRRERDAATDAATDDALPAMAPLELSGRYATDHGWIAFDVVDIQGRFNLNSLRPTGPPTVQPDVPNNLEQRRFVRLLRSLDGVEVELDQAIALTEALLDWLDGDQLETGFSGAELPYYSDQSPPYRTADGAMRDVSELLLVSGMTPELFQALEPLVTVWPLDGGTINVASAGTAVLRSLYEEDPLNLTPLPLERAETLQEAIANGEVHGLAEFLSRPEWGLTPLPPSNLVDSGDLFVISSQTRVGRIDQALDSVVQITDNKAKVLARSLRML